MLPIWAKSNLFKPPSPWISHRWKVSSVPQQLWLLCPTSVFSAWKMAFAVIRIIFQVLLAFEYFRLTLQGEKVTQVIFDPKVSKNKGIQVYQASDSLTFSSPTNCITSYDMTHLGLSGNSFLCYCNIIIFMIIKIIIIIYHLLWFYPPWCLDCQVICIICSDQNWFLSGFDHQTYSKYNEFC